MVTSVGEEWITYPKYWDNVPHGESRRGKSPQTNFLRFNVSIGPEKSNAIINSLCRMPTSKTFFLFPKYLTP